MKTLFAILLLCGPCMAAEPITPQARADRSRVVDQIRRNVAKLSEQDMATLKGIAAKYAAKPKAPAPPGKPRVVAPSVPANNK